MPLNGGWGVGGNGQWQGRRGHDPGQHRFSSWSRNPESISLRNPKTCVKKKQKHGSYLLRFIPVSQFETVLPRKTNQGRCRVQVLHTAGWMCVKQKSWLWCSVLHLQVQKQHFGVIGNSRSFPFSFFTKLWPRQLDWNVFIKPKFFTTIGPLKVRRLVSGIRSPSKVDPYQVK